MTKEHNLHIPPPQKKGYCLLVDWSKFFLCCVSLHTNATGSAEGGICAHEIHLVNKRSWADLKDFEKNTAASTVQWKHNIYSLTTGYSLNINLKTTRLKIYIYTHSSRISSQRIIKGGLLPSKREVLRQTEQRENGALKKCCSNSRPNTFGQQIPGRSPLQTKSFQ